MSKPQSGFTLVELAIVLMIIGLLIGGVLRGQEMLNQARLQGIIKQEVSYEAAYHTFMDAYGAAPGDNTMVLQRLAGCTPQNHCQPGNGDGSIGVAICVWCGSDQNITSENTQFWKQLALAHLISGVNPSADTLEWGRSHPATPFNGGMIVVTAAIPAGWAAGTGVVRPGSIVFALVGSPQEAMTRGAEQVPIMSAKNAAYIDRKIDDGMPDTGSVQSNFANGNFPDAGCEGVYNETQEKPECELMFIM